MLVDVLADPGRFFAEREPELRGPLAVVGLTMAVFVVAGTVGIASGSEIPGVDVRSLPFAVLSNAVGIVLWLSFVLGFYVAPFHLLATVFDGSGSVRETLAVVAWGFLPKILVAVVNLVLVALVVTGQLSAIGSDLVPLEILVEALPIPMLVVSAHVWYHGLTAVHALDAREAVVAVGLPVALAFAVDGLALAAAVVGFGML